MIAEITQGLWIDLNEIYLMNMDDYLADEMLVFIRLHPKYPIIVKGLDAINHLEDLMRKHCEQLARNTENDPRTSETLLEAPDTGTEDTVQSDDAAA